MSKEKTKEIVSWVKSYFSTESAVYAKRIIKNYLREQKQITEEERVKSKDIKFILEDKNKFKNWCYLSK